MSNLFFSFNQTRLNSMIFGMTTPMMIQWQECKNAAPDTLVLFRLGDFYEAFYEDAVILSKELDLTLTKRQNIPMSGIPSHTLEGYVDKLISRNYKVAIAEQMEDPKATKGLVKREISRIVTPGTLLNSSLLVEKTHNYIAALIEVGTQFGLAFVDLTCADCRVIEVDSLAEAFNELYRFQPKEIISSQRMQSKYAAFFHEVKASIHCLVEFIESWRFDHELAYGFLIRQLHVRSLDGFGLKGKIAAINASGALLAHIKETLRTPIGSLRSILPYSKDSFMTIDKATMRHLELIHQENSKSKKHTLLYVLDHTETPMGGRLLKHWISEPLLQLEPIYARHDAVEEWVLNKPLLDNLIKQLSTIRDLERLVIKIAAGTATPREFVGLKNSLIPLETLKKALEGIESELISRAKNEIEDFSSLIALLDKALVEEPPLRLSDGGVIKPGYHAGLDDLRGLASTSKDWMDSYQISLRETTGIKTLKVGYTGVSGFYIEVSKGQADKIPPTFQRRQTLTNAERYITPELKAYESKILTAEGERSVLESSLFQEVRESASQYTDQILKSAKAIALIDCLASLARAAIKNRYTRPKMHAGKKLSILEGRHPVIENALNTEKFIPNDTLLDDSANRLMLITGPNMAGKSTYIRQVALIAIMAQIGSFVPAASAEIGLIDKIFTRIGASDDLSRGQSTFMVEMVETAFILHHATSNSLVILDEIGRGTSTYDGISLAWAIAEHLLTTPDRIPKTLFATHYWELTKLEEKVPGAVNYNVAVHESGEQILFLRKIVKGSTDKSYGIHVAKLAGLPSSVLLRAEEILLHLEENAHQKQLFEAPKLPRRSVPLKETPSVKEIQLTLL